jgi:hypothetical protein
MNWIRCSSNIQDRDSITNIANTPYLYRRFMVHDIWPLAENTQDSSPLPVWMCEPASMVTCKKWLVMQLDQL